MLQRVIIFFLFLSSITAQVIDLKRTNEKLIDLENEKKVMPEDGFYENILSTVTKNGDLFVLDVGNTTLNHYKSNGDFVHSFGKEGNGPGEFNRFLFDIQANDKYIYVKSFSKIMIFDYKGKLIKEIADFLLPRAQMLFEKNNIVFYFPKNELSKSLKAIYSSDGNLVKEVKNAEYDPTALSKMRQSFDDNTLKKNMSRPLSFYPYNNNFVQFYAGPYNFEIVDKSHKRIAKYKASYDRIKVKSFMELMPRQQRQFMKNANAQQKEFFSQIGKKVMSMTNGYKRDIQNVIGANQKYIFIQTSTAQNKNFLLDIIDLKKKKVANIKIETDEVLSAKIENGYLLLNLNNEDDGPYLKIWQVKSI